MTNDEAQAWISSNFGEHHVRLIERYIGLLIAETDQQNLIAHSTIPEIWSRHIVDSAQLLGLAPPISSGCWIDIGSGAGLPGLVIAAVSDWKMVLVEPRRLRAEFLRKAVDQLDLSRRVAVEMSKAENFKTENAAAVISARAVASPDRLFASAEHMSGSNTVWLLPKGRSVQSEVENMKRSWQGVFHVERSIVDPKSGILVARGVAKR